MRKAKRGLTFIEIAIAMVIMAIALLPIFRMIHKGTEDTDLVASQAFAINKATEVLNTMLDNVPFELIRQGAPAYLSNVSLTSLEEYKDFAADKIKKMCEMLFNSSNGQANGFLCQGVVNDARGISYLVTMRCEDVCSPPAPANEIPETTNIGNGFPDSNPSDFGKFKRDDVTFSFLKNPPKLSEPSWTQTYNPRPLKFKTASPSWESDIGGNNQGVAIPPDNIYQDPKFIDPTAARYCQRMATEKVNYTDDDRYAYCTMKKLVVEVQWNLDRQFYRKPETDSPAVQRIHLVTLKCDVNR